MSEIKYDVCPYCGEKLIKGMMHIRGVTFPFWLPEDVKIPAWACTTLINERGGHLLGQLKPFYGMGTRPDTYHCDNCNYIVFDLDSAGF